MYFENRAPVLYAIASSSLYIVNNALQLVRSIDSYLDPTLHSGGGVPLTISLKPLSPHNLFAVVSTGAGSSTIRSTPGYSGRFNPNFSSKLFGTNLPPRKCRPLYSLTPTFGAVKLTRTSGSNAPTFFPPEPSGPGRGSEGLPPSTSHPDGISADTMGSPDRVKRGRTSSNGARTGGLNENPNIASSITVSEDPKAVLSESRSDVVGIRMLSHWVLSLCISKGGFCQSLYSY